MSEETGIVQWQPVDLEAARAVAAEVALQEDGEFMKLAVGKNVVRFLPPAPGQKTCFVVVHEHYIDVPGAKGPFVSACPRMMEKKPCAMCARVAELQHSGNPADRETAYRMRAQKRIYSNVINRKQPELGVLRLGYGKQIFDQLMAILEDEDAGGDFTNPTEQGCDIVIERTGTSKEDTKYSVRCSRKNSALGDMSLIASQPDLLAAVGRARAPEDVEKALRGDFSKGGDGGGKGAQGGGSFGARPAQAPAAPPRRAQTDAAAAKKEPIDTTWEED